MSEDKSFPNLLTFFDLVRQRRSNIDKDSEHTIDDQWIDVLTFFQKRWSGSTRFQILRPRPPSGHTCENGRPTDTQQTPRPDTFGPELNVTLSMKQERIAQQVWDGERQDQSAREKRDIHEIDPNDSEYQKILSDAKDKDGSRSRTPGALRGRTHSR